MWSIGILCFISFIFSWFSVDLIRKRCKLHLLDVPNDRSSHSQPTPRGGGLGFIIAFGLAISMSYITHGIAITGYSIGVWASLLPLICIGILDDIRGISATVRYITQIIVGGLIVLQCEPLSQPWLKQLGIFPPWIEIVITIIVITAIINFYNFMDGTDGLVAGVSIIQLGFMAIWFNSIFNWLLLSALLGFLYWNWSPAKIFMGDVGSTFLGAVMAISLLSHVGDMEQAWSGLAITLPITGDAIYTIVCRLIRSENIFKAHRTHLFQRLNQSGWGHRKVAYAYMGFTLLIAIFLLNYPTLGAWLSLIATFILIASAERYLHLTFEASRN